MPSKTQWLLGIAVAAVMVMALVATHQKIYTKPGLSVLFIGNSYTSVNDLPALFQNIAASAGQAKPEVGASTPGGYSFADEVKDPATLALIHKGPSNGHWDVVVLQNQSEIPAYAAEYPDIRSSSITGAVELYSIIKKANPDARVILFETWARDASLWQQGTINTAWDGKNPDDMQQRLRTWYQATAQQMPGAHVPPLSIARVGDYWQLNYHSPHPIALHSTDGSHPNLAGSYLAALVIFSTMYGTSPTAVTFNASLPDDEATSLKNLASESSLLP